MHSLEGKTSAPAIFDADQQDGPGPAIEDDQYRQTIAHPLNLFKHEPLNLSQSTAIRLLKVLPELSTQGKIQCRLMHHTTARAYYSCLSYRWGSPAKSYVIEIDGKALEVRENLYNFLNVARTTFPFRSLWIDAICLDQANIAERNHQVRNMGHIYKQANDVIVWLGAGNRARAQALECLEHDPGLMQILLDKNIGDYERLIISPIHRIHESLIELCEDEYWGRVWIVQEVLLAKSLSVMYDQTRIDWHFFISFVLADVRGWGKSRAKLWERIQNSCAKTVCSELISLSRHFGYELTTLLSKFGTWKCEDPRDHVLGLIGLTNLNTNKDNLVDYSMDTLTLFKHLARFCLTDSPADARKLLKQFGLSLKDLWATSLDVRVAVPQTQINVSTARFRSLACSSCGAENLRLVEESIPDLLRAHRYNLANLKGSEKMVCLGGSNIQEHLLFYQGVDHESTAQFVGLATSAGIADGAAIKGILLQNSTVEEDWGQRRHLNVDVFGYSYILSAGEWWLAFKEQQMALRGVLRSDAWSATASRNPMSYLETCPRTQSTRKRWLDTLLGKAKKRDYDPQGMDFYQYEALGADPILAVARARELSERMRLEHLLASLPFVMTAGSWRV